ncbi:MAG: hypothetical protein ABSG59_20915 [Verrucomicrobiota bacterium]|jgi:hypothetical protein
MPDGLKLDSLNFSDGKKLTLHGTAPPDKVTEINKFEAALRNAKVNGRRFFDALGGEQFSTHPMPGGVSWILILELKRTEVK